LQGLAINRRRRAERADKQANCGMQKVDTSIRSNRALASEAERAAEKHGARFRGNQP